MQRFLAASVIYVGSVSVDSDVKAPRDLLLMRLFIFGACQCQENGKIYAISNLKQRLLFI